MNLELKTDVKGNYKEIMEAFDLKLFEALKPPIGEMEIVELLGSKKGDKVHIRFLTPVKAEWVSVIILDKVTDDKAVFVDVGDVLPWPLTSWTHRHTVKKVDDTNSIIIDDITYHASNSLLTLLMYPAIFFSFYPRKRVYKNYFNGMFGES